MNSTRVNPLVCKLCEKEFTNVSNKNRHLRRIHNDDSAKVDRIQHILCSLCPHENREKFSSYKSVFDFRSLKEFEAWRGKENRDVDYVSARTLKTKDGETVVYYYCNKSDYRGYESVCEQRKPKLGGSIHIEGICPSRITVRISKCGLYTVRFVETHVGHNNELRSKQLFKSQQNLLVENLAERKTTARIIQDSRDEQDEKLEQLDVKLEQLDVIANGGRQHNESMNFEERREMALEELRGFVNSLDEVNFHKFMEEMWKFRIKMEPDVDQHISKKRKV